MPNNTNLVYGGDFMVFLNSTGATNLQPMAFATSAKLTITLSTRDITSKDSGDWDEKLGGKFTWNLGSDNLMNLSGVTGTTLSTKEMYNLMIAKAPVYIAFASKTGTSPSWTVATSAVKFTGMAIITSIDMNASNGETATYSVALEGTGVLAVAQ